MIKTPFFQCRGWVQVLSLVRELRSHIPLGEAKKLFKSREEKENNNKGDGAQEIQARNHFRTLFEKS